MFFYTVPRAVKAEKPHQVSNAGTFDALCKVSRFLREVVNAGVCAFAANHYGIHLRLIGSAGRRAGSLQKF